MLQKDFFLFIFSGNTFSLRERKKERSRVPAWAAQPSSQLLECFRNFCTCFSLEDGQNTFWCSGWKRTKKREGNQIYNYKNTMWKSKNINIINSLKSYRVPSKNQALEPGNLTFLIKTQEEGERISVALWCGIYSWSLNLTKLAKIRLSISLKIVSNKLEGHSDLSHWHAGNFPSAKHFKRKLP